MLRIFRGRESIDKEKFIYESIRGGTASAQADGASGMQGRYIVVVPDQYTLAAERQAMDRLKSDVLLNIEITGISRLGSKILDYPPRGTIIDVYGRHMLISRLLREMDEELVVLKGFYGRETFITAINNFISAAKHHEVSWEALMKLAEGSIKNSGTGAFGRKLKDLALIYRRYSGKLEGKYTDNEDLLSLYINAIEDSEEIPKNEIWFYGFDSYTPKNMRFIAALAKKAVNVNVYIPYDKDCMDEDLFALSESTTERLIKAAAEFGVDTQVQDVKDVKKFGRVKRESLKTLERELFAVSKNTSDDFDGIEIVRCNSMDHEAEAAAAKVLSLLKDEGMRLSDIVLICNDQQTGNPLIGRAFREFGLNVFDDKKRSVINSPIAMYILSLMDAVVNGYPRNDVIRFLKTGLTGIETGEIEEIENYTYKYGIKGRMWKEPFVLGKHEKRYEDGGLEQIEETRKKVMAIFNGFSEIYESSGSYGEFAERYFNFLTEENGLASQVDLLIERQEAAGLLDSAEENAQIWDVVYRLFMQIVEIMDDEPFDGKSFSELLKSGLSALQVGVLPPTVDDILLGTMQRTRSGDVKALIVIGANDTLLPRKDEEDPLFSPEELELLAEDGEDLGIGSNLRLMEENLAIYRNLAAPSEQLWISYSSQDPKGAEMRPSIIIESIKDIFPGLEVQDDPIASDDFFLRLGGHINTLRRYTEALRREKYGAKLDPKWEVVENWLETTDNELFGRVRDAVVFENVQEPLPLEIAKQLYSKRLGKDGKPIFSLSPSSIERYGRCPFSYFIGYGLGAQELRVNEAGVRELGDLYHNALQGVFEEISKGGIVDTVSREEVYSRVEEIAKEWAEDYSSNVFGRTESEKYRFNRAVETCKFVAWTLVNQARQGSIEGSYFEVPFGMSRANQSAAEEGEAGGAAGSAAEGALILPPIIKEVEAGTAYIRGVIDRVDILEDGRVKIIDYKTGNEYFDKDEVAKGLRLQLMLYMEAAQEGKREPAGVFYFLIKEPEREINGQPDDAENERELMKSYQMQGIMLDDDQVIEEIAGDFPADSSSDVVNLKRTKSGSIHSSYKKMLLTDEEFKELQDEVDAQVVQIIDNITAGEIPLEIKVSNKISPCTYCAYHGICRFDTVFEGCKEINVKR